MDIQAEKQEIIKWLEGINDVKIIEEFKSLKKLFDHQESNTLSKELKEAIDLGLSSREDDRIYTSDEAFVITKSKFPEQNP